MKNGDQPINHVTEAEKDRHDFKSTLNYLGLTKREYFATMAMQGLLANHAVIEAVNSIEIEYIQSRSVALADALLSELEKPTDK